MEIKSYQFFLSIWFPNLTKKRERVLNEKTSDWTQHCDHYDIINSVKINPIQCEPV